ncbi:response regulator transcription factor [Rugosimonospora acidiphila]|uniref:Response regulator transcription factor n=1 Tax=Rugosimonospora acidiphila TaxID=556531 RepID=A0ABP9STF6_9ACTN
MRVVLAEDHELLRDALSLLLSVAGFEIAATVTDGRELLPTLLRTRPDVAVVDVRLPPTHTDEGLRAAIAARERVPGMPILVLSQHVQRLYARQLLRDGAGGVGYLLKDRVAGGGELIDALHRLAAGATVMDPKVVAGLLSAQTAPGPLNRLSAREAEVLAVMAEGRSNTAIAARLRLSEGAVSKYTTSIFAKLGIHAHDDDNRRVLAVLAYLDATG